MSNRYIKNNGILFMLNAYDKYLQSLEAAKEFMNKSWIGRKLMKVPKEIK